MRTLYFDCFAGASGNMILGALLALGVDGDDLLSKLKMLDVADFEFEISFVDRSGVSATHVEVKVPHEHVHRHLQNIEKILNDSRLSPSVKDRAKRIFRRLAEVEAKIHGIDVQKVHFHEVGAMDAIIDVVGACIGFEMLGVEAFACSKIHVGSGFAKMAHGTFPVPAPAVAELLAGAPIYSTDIEGELITPTGAAIISTVCDSYGQIPEIRVKQIGYGAGSRQYKDFPNVLRLMVGETVDAASHQDRLTLIETNIDDVSPQILGYVMEKALLVGALDCWFTAIQMKKNRPATMVSILCETAKKDEFVRLLYSETTTIGVRVGSVERECLVRDIERVSTRFGEIDVKVARLEGDIVNAKPEFDQLRKMAETESLPLKDIEAEVAKAIALTN
ncbi:MAG: nickel pincer cofactor biosynthesis protein LarC [Acidobacteriota bacterium]